MTDIEQALAEALHAKRLHHSRGGADADLAKTGCEQHGLEPCRNLVRLLMSLEPMQAIARQAAIGAAVERLAATGEVDPHLYFTDAVYHALAYRVHQGTPPDSAIAAALEDEG